MTAGVSLPSSSNAKILKDAIHDYKALLNEAGVVLNSEFQIEFSHHYGIENFRKVGALIINCINREYCKKIIVQLPGQSHPMHFHKRKEETFQVLDGDLNVVIGNHEKALSPGETALIQPGVWHSFHQRSAVCLKKYPLLTTMMTLIIRTIGSVRWIVQNEKRLLKIGAVLVWLKTTR